MTRPLKISRPIPAEAERFQDDLAVAIHTTAATMQRTEDEIRAAMISLRGFGRLAGFDRDSYSAVRSGITDDNLRRPTRRAEEHYTKDKLSTRRGAVHSVGELCGGPVCCSGLFGCVAQALTAARSYLVWNLPDIPKGEFGGFRSARFENLATTNE